MALSRAGRRGLSPDASCPLRGRMGRRTAPFAACAAALIAAACRPALPPEAAAARMPVRAQPADANRDYTGSERCRECHTAQFESWQASHHALAERDIDLRLDATAFENQPIIQHGSRSSRVRRRGSVLEVLTLSGDAKEGAFEPRRVLGVAPLRQFLVPGPAGRWQVLPLAYDPDRGDWFDVFGGDDRSPREWGFWANRGMNWNSMCAACHNTNVRKGYDPADDSYDTTMAERGVGCEACHGPGRAHVEWQERHAGRASDPTAPRMGRDAWIDACGACHARRVELRPDFEPGQAFLNAFRPELPGETAAYYLDGQVHEENYEYASFLLSRMHGEGVSCMNCHDPHSCRPRHAGNALCLACHAGKVEPASHAHHDPAGAGGQCVDCHMPQTVYMQRHARRDHAFTIPDPVLTRELGIPNACNRCHADQSVAWAIEHAERWYGKRLDRPTRRRTRQLAAAQRGDETALPDLIAYLRTERSPAWRAVAAGLLRAWADRPDAHAALLQCMSDGSALVRTIAAGALDPLGLGAAEALKTAWNDPVRAVRLAAGWALRTEVVGTSPLYGELMQFLTHAADQPPGAVNLAIWHMDRGEPGDAVVWLERAAAWEPDAPQVHHYLSVALSAAGRLREAVDAARRACVLAPHDPPLWHALGLAEAGVGDLAAAEDALAQACRMDNGFGRAWYNLGLVRRDRGNAEGAVEALQRCCELDDQDAAAWLALAAVLDGAGRRDEAAEAARRVLQLDPTNAAARSLLTASPEGAP